MTLARPVVVAVVALTFVGLAAAAHPGAQEPEAVEAELALDRPTRRLIQQGLAAEGFDPGAPDGLFGPRTRAAIRAWQAAREHAGTGYLDAAQAGALRTAAAPPRWRQPTRATRRRRSSPPRPRRTPERSARLPSLPVRQRLRRRRCPHRRFPRPTPRRRQRRAPATTGTRRSSSRPRPSRK